MSLKLLALDYLRCQPASMDDATFIAAFERQAFPHNQWHHREHIKIAYLYLLRYPLAEATSRLREGILALNAVHKVPDAPDRGYHETMTQAWMRLVKTTLDEFGPSNTADAFVEQHSQLLSKRALLFFYSRDRLMSLEAKQKFVEPDLTPLPCSEQARVGSWAQMESRAVGKPA